MGRVGRRNSVSRALLFASTLLAGLVQGHSPHDVINQLSVTLDADGNAVLYAGMKATAKSLIARSLDGGASWQLMALPLEERDFTAIAVSPNYAQDDEVIIAGKDFQGVYLNRNGKTGDVEIDQTGDKN